MKPLIEDAAGFGVALSDAQTRLFQAYHEELAEWASRVNLTSVTDAEGVRTRHFLDSLSVALALQGRIEPGVRLLDVGSGAGFPGLPLKIAFPHLSTTLIEATAKKTAFLHHLVDALGLSGVEVLTGRAETLGREPALRESFDLVTARAVAKMPALAELTLPFCRVGGLMVAQKGGAASQEAAEALPAIEAMGGTLRDVLPVDAPPGQTGRALVVLEKVAPTPARYPRRPGIPMKRPVGR